MVAFPPQPCQPALQALPALPVLSLHPTFPLALNQSAKNKIKIQTLVSLSK
jgi:hypothetical protein